LHYPVYVHIFAYLLGHIFCYAVGQYVKILKYGGKQLVIVQAVKISDILAV
jgi:hypothetical protein